MSVERDAAEQREFLLARKKRDDEYWSGIGTNIVRALIANPALHDHVGELGHADFMTEHAAALYRALANLRGRGSDCTPETIRAELQAEHDRRGSHRAGERVRDLSWLDEFLSVEAKPFEPGELGRLAKMLRGYKANYGSTGERLDQVAQTIELAAQEFAVAESMPAMSDIPPPGDDDAPPEIRRLHIVRDSDIDVQITRAPQPAPRAAAPAWHRMPALVDAIMSHASDPWAKLTLGGETLVEVRAGGYAVVMGPTGAGKTSLACGLLIEHARERGPVVVLSRELPADELAARAIGMQCDASWADVLRGRVEVDEMRRRADLPRMFIADRRNATLEILEAMIKAARAEYPGEVVLAAIDYVQLIESTEKEARAKVSDSVIRIDEILRAHGAVGIMISQMSRASSRAARKGEAMGADSTDAGAESAAIERAATVTLSIGQSGPRREDGTCEVEINLGKHRMGSGDSVIPASYDGRSGRWRIAGEARPAAEVRAEHSEKIESTKLQVAKMAILGAIGEATEPKTRAELGMGIQTAVRTAAIRELLREPNGVLVEVRVRAPRSSSWKLWTRTKAVAAGMAIVDGDEGES